MLFEEEGKEGKNNNSIHSVGGTETARINRGIMGLRDGDTSKKFLQSIQNIHFFFFI